MFESYVSIKDERKQRPRQGKVQLYTEKPGPEVTRQIHKTAKPAEPRPAGWFSRVVSLPSSEASYGDPLARALSSRTRRAAQIKDRLATVSAPRELTHPLREPRGVAFDRASLRPEGSKTCSVVVGVSSSGVPKTTPLL